MRRMLVLFTLIAGTLLMSQQNPHGTKLPEWEPYPAGHWPQEPDGYGGMKLQASRADIQKTVQLVDCEPMRNGALCQTTVEIGGRPFKASLMFGGPEGTAPENQKLSSLSVQLSNADFPFVKAAFTKMFGLPLAAEVAAKRFWPPHEGWEEVFWQGNKTQIRMASLPNQAFVVVEHNWVATGGLTISIESMRVVTRRNQ